MLLHQCQNLSISILTSSITTQYDKRRSFSYHDQKVQQKVNTRSSIICGAKKKKKKSKSNTEDSGMEPQRILPGQQIKPKLQIQLVREREKRNQQKESAFVAKSYVKPKKTKEERLKEEEQKEKEYEEFINSAERIPTLPTFSNAYGTKGKERKPLIVVDGYNLLFTYDKMGAFIGIIELHEKRQILIDQVRDYADLRRVACYMVFDGKKLHNTPNKYDYGGNFMVFFTDEEGADSFIERKVLHLNLEKQFQYVMVVTSDRVLKEMSVPSYNYSCPEFIQEMWTAEQERRKQFQEWEMEFEANRRRTTGIQNMMSAETRLKMDAQRLGMNVRQYKEHLEKRKEIALMKKRQEQELQEQRDMKLQKEWVKVYKSDDKQSQNLMAIMEKNNPKYFDQLKQLTAEQEKRKEDG